MEEFPYNLSMLWAVGDGLTHGAGLALDLGSPAGVAIEADFRWPNGARSIYVRDPAGTSVELAERPLWRFG
jgi:catechol 2,3-dioxygenase-like lactoylglutathione lyase family enzyme